MSSLTASFECPHCGNPQGYRIIDFRRGTHAKQCFECGYYEYIVYKLSDNGDVLKIDETKELDYDNLQTEEVVKRPGRKDKLIKKLSDEEILAFFEQFRQERLKSKDSPD